MNINTHTSITYNYLYYYTANVPQSSITEYEEDSELPQKLIVNKGIFKKCMMFQLNIS